MRGLLAHEGFHPATHYLNFYGLVAANGVYGLAPAEDTTGQYFVPGSIDNVMGKAVDEHPNVEDYIEKSIRDCHVCD